MSPRAAARLESLGFTQLFDYVDGKMDWFANDLPAEGELPDAPYLGQIARRDVPTCRLGDGIGSVREQVHARGWDRCVVVDENGLALGLLESETLAEQADGDASAEAVMTPGPTTFRPNVPVAEIVHAMHENELDGVLVTTSGGKLVGYVSREDAQQAIRDSGRAEADGSREHGASRR